MHNIKIWKTIDCLLKQNPTTTSRLKQQLSYSEKSIRTYLKACLPILERYDLVLDIKPGKGYFLSGDSTQLALLKNEIYEQLYAHDVRMEKEDRVIYILYKLLCYDKSLRITDLENELFVTRPSLHHDLDKIRTWLIPYELSLESSRKTGLFIPSNEKRKRKALCQLIQTSTEQLTTFNQPFYPDEFCQYTLRFSYEHPRMQNILKFIHTLEETNNFKISEKDMLFLCTMIGVSLDRIQQNHVVSVNEYIKESIADFPLVEYMFNHQETIATLFHVRIPEEEIYYFSALFHSLKHTNFDSIAISTDPMVHHIVQEFVPFIYHELPIHPESKQSLEDSLSYHLQTMLDKTRFDYDFTNPLLHEIKDKYHDVYQVAERIRPIILKYANIRIPDDEVAFLVLHIAAAAERSLQPLKALFIFEHRHSEIKFSSSLIEAHIKEARIVESMKYHDYLKLNTDDSYDIILTSFPFKSMDQEVFYVPVLPDKDDIKKLQEKIRKIFTQQDIKMESTLGMRGNK